MKTPSRHLGTPGGALGAPSDPPSTRKLVRSMEKLAANPSIALQVMWACDDPKSSARSVGEESELDPILTAKLLKLANSAMYSLRIPVTNGHRAVAVLGFSTVRAMAALAAGGDHIRLVPAGFWEHSAAVAASARGLARRFGASADDAFALGLLHELGIALLEGLQPGGWDLVAARGGGREVEREVFGITHDAAAVEVFRAWRLPDTIIDAVRGHARPLGDDPPMLTALLVAAEGLADLAMGPWGPCRAPGGADALASLGLEPETLDKMVAEVRDIAVGLAGAMSS